MTIEDVKRNFIVQTAARLFCARSIAEVTVRDVAQAAGVGEATIYRHFTKKQNIVLAVAETLQAQVYREYFDLSGGKNGYEKIAVFFASYEKVFRDRPDFYKFIREFDAFMLSGGEVSETYSSGMEPFRCAFLAAYKEGIADGSVRPLPDPEGFYYAAAHAMLELCKKLSAGRGIVPRDAQSDKAAEVAQLKNALLYYVKHLPA